MQEISLRMFGYAETGLFQTQKKRNIRPICFNRQRCKEHGHEERKSGPFDLDYNLEIIKAPDEYRKDLRCLKNTVRILLDEATGLECFSESKDSTSCLTALLYFKDEPTIEFSFDVAIVAKNCNGTLCRLIHNKNIWGYGNGQYVWNEVPSSRDVAAKAHRIKAEGLWLEVREHYVALKEMYLSRQWDKDHPSCIVYIEAVNNIYNKYFR